MPDKGEQTDNENQSQPEEEGKMVESDQVQEKEDSQEKQPEAEGEKSEADKKADFDAVSFIDKLENVSPEEKEKLKEGYLRQADYTKKTQNLAAIRKQAEFYQKVSPYLNRIFSDPKLTKQFFGNSFEEEPKEEEIPDDPKEYAEYIKNKTLQDVNNILRQRDLSAREEKAREAEFAQAEAVDSRLNSDPAFAKAIAGLVAQDQAYLNREINAVEATRRAISFFDNYINKVKGETKQALINKAKNKPSMIANSSGGKTISSEKIETMRDAWKAAEKEASK